MDQIMYLQTEYFKKELKRVLTTINEPIPYIDASYFIQMEKNGKEVTYFNDKNQRGCFSEFEKTEEGTRYQILWHDNNEDNDEFYYKITEPTDVKSKDIYQWNQLRSLPGNTRYLTKGTLTFLEENEDKCSEIIDTAKRLRADVFGYTPEERAAIYNDKSIVEKVDAAFYNDELEEMLNNDTLEEIPINKEK